MFTDTSRRSMYAWCIDAENDRPLTFYKIAATPTNKPQTEVKDGSKKMHRVRISDSGFGESAGMQL